MSSLAFSVNLVGPEGERERGREGEKRREHTKSPTCISCTEQHMKEFFLSSLQSYSHALKKQQHFVLLLYFNTSKSNSIHVHVFPTYKTVYYLPLRELLCFKYKNCYTVRFYVALGCLNNYAKYKKRMMDVT